ncbi:hypothetical protein [Agrobacterium sp. SORGH_AS 787]|uniref:hypothetical protein n=1 Tax=Agrobacterium sp. SORGH_AS 787 TaxID=3041775 RepID=UPI0027860B89|nr:hypothetical protein [Rhizobium sp. SORGH_AS_0787]
MGDDLKDVLTILYLAGAEKVPASELAWNPSMLAAINVAVNMGYMRYSVKDGMRYFFLTDAGYHKIGIPAFSVRKYLFAKLKGLIRSSR